MTLIPALTDTGVQFGGRPAKNGRTQVAPTVISFHNDGPLGDSTMLRNAWRVAPLTAMGMIGGTLRIVRMKEVLAALSFALGQSGNSLLGHLLAVWSTPLTAIYGDFDTLESLKAHIAASHRMHLPSELQPGWYKALNAGTPETLHVNSALLQQTVSTALAASVMQAHKLAGLVPDETEYLNELEATFGFVIGVQFPGTLSELCELRDTYVAMTAEEFASTPGADLLESIYPTALTVGENPLTLQAAITKLAAGLASTSDRTALGINWGADDQNRLADWCASQGAVANGPDNWFTVAHRGRIQV